jgi:hypothetical protein
MLYIIHPITTITRLIHYNAFKTSYSLKISDFLLKISQIYYILNYIQHLYQKQK